MRIGLQVVDLADVLTVVEYVDVFHDRYLQLLASSQTQFLFRNSLFRPRPQIGTAAVRHDSLPFLTKGVFTMSRRDEETGIGIGKETSNLATDHAQREPEQQDNDGGYASREEVVEAIQKLTDADVKKLMVVAKSWFRKFPVRPGYGSPEDILQEAIRRSLEPARGGGSYGRRRWRRSVVSIVKHLDRTMESIARNTPGIAAKDRGAERTAHALDEPHAPRTEGTSAPNPPHSSTPESQLSAREELENLARFFKDDPEALAAIRCRAHGMEASEIRAELGIGEKEWETVRKRIQRMFVRYGDIGGGNV